MDADVPGATMTEATTKIMPADRIGMVAMLG